MIHFARPEGFTRRDLLCGVIAVTAARLAIPEPQAYAANACKELFDSTPVLRAWYPAIDPAHARAAIAFAGRAFHRGHITQDEYDFVVEKARRVILQPHAKEILQSCAI